MVKMASLREERQNGIDEYLRICKESLINNFVEFWYRTGGYSREDENQVAQVRQYDKQKSLFPALSATSYSSKDKGAF